MAYSQLQDSIKVLMKALVRLIVLLLGEALLSCSRIYFQAHLLAVGKIKFFTS
jgi:hypothetical protein